MELYYLLCGAALGAVVMMALWLIGDAATDKENDFCRYGERKDDVDDGR